LTISENISYEGGAYVDLASVFPDELDLGYHLANCLP
jgi:hypothetical protein